MAACSGWICCPAPPAAAAAAAPAPLLPLPLPLCILSGMACTGSFAAAGGLAAACGGVWPGRLNESTGHWERSALSDAARSDSILSATASGSAPATVKSHTTLPAETWPRNPHASHTQPTHAHAHTHTHTHT
eukprot:1561507-Rhodomonas_salina.1